MKAVILAGGLGTRLAEETHLRPNLWLKLAASQFYTFKIYSSYGINEFIICLGYKGYLIKDFFLIIFFILMMLLLI